MILIDIDGLKDVNDTLGHAQGDELISSMAAVIAARVRETDIIARLGGDEFGVLMPNTGHRRRARASRSSCWRRSAATASSSAPSTCARAPAPGSPASSTRARPPPT